MALRPCQQIFTFFWLFRRKKVPLYWALLAGKSQLNYDYVTLTLCQKFHEVLSKKLPKMIKSDFGTGFIAAVNIIFGNRTIHKACYFHSRTEFHES